jgi:hypothetical protein
MTKALIPKYKTVDELMKGAAKSTLLEDVRQQITKESALELSDSDVANELAGWSMIANKIVGHEHEPTL